MDILRQIWQWLVEAEAWEWVFSGIGLPIAGWLILRYRRKPPAQDTSPPNSSTVSNTFTHSGNGDQNIGQGKNAIGKKVDVDVRGAQIEVGSRQTGVLGDNAHIDGGIHFHNHDRTPQGIPLQRSQQAEHLVGRQELLKDVLAALQPGKVVTLCGPGGIGKTALASRVAWELSPDGKPPACFPDGLIFYSFYGRKDVSFAFDHLVRSFSDDPQDNSPEAVCHLLANKQALIILDGAEESDDLPTVLRCCGGCGVLITSRKRSDAPGRLFEVKPLDELPAAEAFRLYSNTDADENTVQAICQQLGGWPLALRLAGHYLRNTGESATDYVRFLAKVPFQRLGRGEHQDENAALLLRRSMEQVSEDARLALGMAGCLAFAPMGREPLMALLATNELRACDALNELVLYGLLERQGQRWQVSHALIHTFARSEQPLRRENLERLAGYYIDFCETQSAAGLLGYALLDEERVHCLRLMESCLDRELWQEVKGLAQAIWEYLDRQVWWTELQASFKMNLIAARKAGNRRAEAWCLSALGYSCAQRGESDNALVWHEQSLAMNRERNDWMNVGAELNNIAEIYRQQGKHEQSLNYYKQSLSIRQEVGSRKSEGESLNNIGEFYREQGEHELALQYYEQSLSIAREVDHHILEGAILNNIGLLSAAQGKMIKALEYYQRSLDIAQEMGNLYGEANTYLNIGFLSVEQSDLVKAEVYIALAVKIAEQIELPNLEEWRDILKQVRAARRGA